MSEALTGSSTTPTTRTTSSTSEPSPALAEPALRGRLVLKDQVIQTIAETAALEVASVVKTSSPFNPLQRSLPRASATLSPSHARVTVAVATRFDRPFADIASEVRDTVAATITRLTAMTVDIVNVDISTVTAETAHPDTTPEQVRRILQ